MQFEVRALRGTDALMAFAVDATNAEEAATRMRAQGYTIIGVKAKIRGGVTHRASAFPLLLFSQELLALLEAGLPLLESLEALADKEQNADTCKTLRGVITCLREGHPLSHALQHAPVKFPALYLATVRASEKTGALPEALSRFIAYQTQMDVVRRAVVSASIYPLMLASVGTLVTLFLLLYVVPRFSHVYADIGGDLPLMSRLLMQWGQLLEGHEALVLAVFAVGVAGAIYAVSRPLARDRLVRLLWQIPTLGRRLHVYQLARFYRSLGMLLRAGMPVVTALHMASELLQPALRERLTLASGAIGEGRPMSLTMEQYGLTTPIALRLLRVGERTGRMGEMMERIATFHEEATARWVERFTRVFEPLLMVFIGLVIGVIVVLMYFPIFELAGSIQ